MAKYIGKRLLFLILVLLGVSFIVFTLLYISPGDPAKIMLGEAASEEALEALCSIRTSEPLTTQADRF